MYSPSIPYNVTNWKLFDDDEQILYFLSAQETFQGMEIDEAEHDKSLFDISNIIPKSVINLDKFYDLQDKFKQMTNYKTQSSSLNYELVNLGTEQNPRLINLGVNFPNEERRYFIKLCKEFKDVFAWMYKELKTFDTNIMHHNILMKP